jgi:hypothetical protein
MRYVFVISVLAAGLFASVATNIYQSAHSSTADVVGVVDHKSIGEGTNRRSEPVTWYTISLWLVTEDDENGMAVGGTLAYIVDKEVYDQIEVGDVIEGRAHDDLKLDQLRIVRSDVPRQLGPSEG